MNEALPIIDVLHALPLAHWLRSASAAYPSLEVIHIVGLATVFGSILIVDLRLLGALKDLDAARLGRSVLPWTLFGFLVAAISGSLMFLAHASDFIGNPMLLTKLMLLLAAGINAAMLHARGPLQAGNPATRMHAALSVLIWVAVIYCGRWIAYV